MSLGCLVGVELGRAEEASWIPIEYRAGLSYCTGIESLVRRLCYSLQDL